ncbi:metal cation symporter ZIP8 isoform X1 [Coregonus clupeaformis]|uniref:metal cation symporter ZIP8 isoform X1 n=1 Tax=Coregonus clupeaformis TaxID=59861 RepID=UPI001BE06C62|nr:metal cation symporter ZIP8 isoform X1 [Coregonus clupeaformis]
MYHFRSLVPCALLFILGWNCVQVDGKKGQGFLEDMLQFYGENDSISTAHLENFLLLISTRRPAFIVDEENPLVNSECLSVGQILSHYELTNASQLTVEHLERICPAVLTQVLLPSCPYKKPTALKPVTYHVWGYGFLSVTIINLASLLGLALIPFTKKPYFPKVLTYFIGLAIGTLFSNAVLQLIPEALGFDPRADNYILNAIGIFGGFYLLFFTEKVLKMALRTEHEHGHSHFSPPGQLRRQNSLQNGDVSEKKESITMTTCTISSISTDNTGPDPPDSSTEPPPQQEVHVNHVMCHWLRGQRIANIKTVAWMITLSDALHNFIDGLAIGASFTVSVVAGFSTSIAIVCEEFPHELGDFVILLNAGMSIPQAVFFNLLSAMSCYIGLAFGILLGSNFAPNAIFAIAGGMFLYIALADMFPEMNAIVNEQDGSTVTNVIFFLIQNAGLLTGFAIILLITMFVGEINLG